MTKTGTPFRNFEEFFPYYLEQHAHIWTVRIHTIGLMLGFLVALYAFATGTYAALLLLPVVTYGILWISHLAFEHNHPASLQHPVWSFYSEFKMVFLYVTGRLETTRKLSQT